MPGKVYIVGGGPGDPELLTRKAHRLIEAADVVFHDKLLGPGVLDLVPEEKRADVGSRASGEGTPQEYRNRWMVALAREGKTVVRLKGGDPGVFGRGGEEMEHLAREGVPFEVVPGITSPLAAGVAGIPLTHRDHASNVTLVTGHEDPDKEESAVDWAALAAAGGTIVVLMGVRRLPEYTRALVEEGMAPETPVALVERATWPDGRAVTGTLETIVDARDEEGVEPPALTVIGDVVSTRERVRPALVDRTATGVAEPGGSGGEDEPGKSAGEDEPEESDTENERPACDDERGASEP